MESVINKLAEIETAATKIMQAAENQKKLQDEQQEERIAKFDADLEAETAKRIEEITISGAARYQYCFFHKAMSFEFLNF